MQMLKGFRAGFFILWVTAAMAQSRPCALNAVGDDVQIFACSGLKAQSAEVLEILNKIAGDKLDPRAVLAKINELPKGAGARAIELTEEQKKELTALVKMYPGQKVSVVYPRNDAVAGKGAAEIVAILAGGGWLSLDGSPLTRAAEVPTEKAFLGVEVALNDHDLEEQQFPKAAIPVTLSLQAMGFARHPGSGPEIPRGAIQLKVGTPP
jgi:hypothetical protein